MADAARCNVASVCQRVWCVTSVAASVRSDSCWNRYGRAASQRAAVATGAAVLRPRASGHVLRVIEFHVEAFFEFVGESFARRIVAVHGCVTDRTHRDIRRGELREVTARA